MNSANLQGRLDLANKDVIVMADDRRSSDDAELGRLERIYGWWGRHPAAYAAQDWVTFLGRPGPIRSAAVRGVALVPGARVLEVGCGTGRNLPGLRRAVGPSGEVVGVDVSAESVAAARGLVAERGWSNVRIEVQDAARLEVMGRFDGVLAVLALSAVPDHRAVLRRIHEVLEDDGRLAVCDARPFPDRLQVLNPLIEHLYGRLAGWHPDRDVIGAIRDEFGSVEVDSHNLGTFFIATASRETP